MQIRHDRINLTYHIKMLVDLCMWVNLLMDI